MFVQKERAHSSFLDRTGYEVSVGLIEGRRGDVTAMCEVCKMSSIAVMESREIAILRLMRSEWRVRTVSGVTYTWCPTCQTAPGVARKIVA